MIRRVAGAVTREPDTGRPPNEAGAPFLLSGRDGHNVRCYRSSRWPAMPARGPTVTSDARRARWGVLSLLLSILFGLFRAWIRLWDFRLTAQLARARAETAGVPPIHVSFAECAKKQKNLASVAGCCFVRSYLRLLLESPWPL